MKDKEYQYSCRVSWENSDKTLLFWDDICARTFELFGLPGDRYITDLSADHMTWIFKTEADQLLFKLKFSESLS